MDWSIRRAGPGDSGRLSVVGMATFLDSYAGLLDGDAIVAHCLHQNSEATYRRFLADGAAAAWLAEASEGGASIGYALLTAPDLPIECEPGDLELRRIYCLSRFHGRGIGAGLMRHAADHSAAQGATRLLLGVYERNQRALAFYAKCGFKQIGDRLFQVGAREYYDLVLARPL